MVLVLFVTVLVTSTGLASPFPVGSAQKIDKTKLRFLKNKSKLCFLACSFSTFCRFIRDLDRIQTFDVSVSMLVVCRVQNN